jgi:hypothetical protein
VLKRGLLEGSRHHSHPAIGHGKSPAAAAEVKKEFSVTER